MAKRHERNAFLSSCVYLAGMLTSVVFGVYPMVLLPRLGQAVRAVANKAIEVTPRPTALRDVVWRPRTNRGVSRHKPPVVRSSSGRCCAFFRKPGPSQA